MEEPPVHLEADDARAGVTPHIVRYVLVVSLGLVILSLVILGLARQF
jgi:hypothetical protein